MTPAATRDVLTRNVLARNDFLRTPVLAAARPDAFKEWHHFLVQGPERRILVNFSLMTETLGGRAPRLVPRVIVIVHDGRWTGVIERYDESAVGVSADLCALSVGGNRMRVGPDGFHVVLDVPGHRVRGELVFTVGDRASFGRVNNQQVGAGRISWLFVPRLRATGRLRVGDREHELRDEVAYHDHNWGHFRWGDDFGWEWGSILPADASDPWSVVFTRKTDRRRLRCLSQALYLWHHDTLTAMFRDAAIRVESSGLLGRAPDCTLPPPMRLVVGGAAADVPATVTVTGSSADGSVRAVFHPQSHARLAQPSELHLDRSVVLSEISGTARMTGSAGGHDLDTAGTGVFELLHG